MNAQRLGYRHVFLQQYFCHRTPPVRIEAGNIETQDLRRAPEKALIFLRVVVKEGIMIQPEFALLMCGNGGFCGFASQRVNVFTDRTITTAVQGEKMKNHGAVSFFYD